MRPDLPVRERVTKARTQLLMDEPFFGLLALRLKLKEDPSCADMWTDSVWLGYNPGYVEELSDLELRGLIAHVIMHIASGHPWRQGSRDSKRWNKAADLAINHVLKKAGFRLPPGSLEPDEVHAGKPAELIYVALQKEETPPEPQPQAGEDGDEPDAGQAPDAATSSGPGEDETGDDLPGPGAEDGDGEADQDGKSEGSGGSGENDKQGAPAPGEVRPAPEGSSEAEWKMALQAAVRMQGNLPGELQRLVDLELQPRVDWKEVLRQFMQSSVYSPDYNWSRPNRRWLHQGLYMPGLHGQNIGCIVIARDTSGSIGDDYLSVFNAEILDILLTLKPEVAYIVDCDAAVAQVIAVEPLDVPDSLPAKGGGGTRFEPVFQWIQEQGLDPACVVYLTDLEGSFPATDPGMPVMWAVPEGHAIAKQPPFGDLLSMTLN